jgi:hypothetical protein
MSRTFLLLMALTVVAFVGSAAFGQDPEGYYERGKLTEINNLLSGDELEGCSAESKRLAGTVTAVRFSEGRKIGDFTLRTTTRQTVKIEISPDLYERISKKDATALPTLVAKSRRITVDVHICGSARRALYIIAGIHTDVLG